jgi:DNA polymerase-3 subunit beta
MPILANVLIECQKSNIRITATDLEVGVRGEFEGEILKEGTITVSAKKLYEIIREVPTEEVQLKRLENDWVEIKSGKSVFKIVGMEGREFPQFPDFQADQLLTVPAGALREMIERTLFAVSTDETRIA